jgi:hypothetical protein
MAAARSPRRRESQLAFEALSIEGGLLSPEWLSRVGQLSAGAQSEAEYRVPKGLNLRDEIGRYWRIAQAHWREFDAGRSAGAAARALADRFVPPLLRDSFGFDSLAASAPVVIADRTYAIGFSALGGRVPVVIAPAGSGVDALASSFGDGGRRRSAFGVVQEFLNASADATWGLVSDGLTLRIVRDNASLTRPAWIEADIERIFTEGRYADFAALWLLAHETRFGKPGQTGAGGALEAWRVAGREEGTRAREHLRRGVEEAVVALGQGFLSHPDNMSLRTALQDGSLTKTAYFQQLLRLVYRLIFLLTVEERGLLHPNESSEVARQMYAEGYGLKRLRDRSVKRSAHDRFSDLWEAMKIAFCGVANGEPRLALPALAGLFAKTQCASLDAAKLENHALLLAVFRLSWLREASGLSRVNWRDMGPEELGSVYEGLLELQPQITQGGRAFGFATGGEAKGHARKTTGSYYTPDSLVQVLLDSALEPVVQSTIAAHAEEPVQALLSLSVVDPACGSGHFLLAAARRLAAHVARLQANGTPSAAEYRHALRQVVGRCIYGVDLNPMAVELCKVSLWMEAVEPGLPLTFLNSHIQHGNALIGATPALMENGVPDAAWNPLEGDDKKVAAALKKRNKKAATGQRGLSSVWSEPGGNGSAAVARAVAELEGASDADAGALARKESQWKGILESEAYRHQVFVADAWCAAFVWPKQSGPLADAAPRLIEILGFINERKLFPSVLHNFKFVVFVVSGEPQSHPAECVFNCYSVDETRDPLRRFQITHSDLVLLNPETRTCPVFFWKRSADISKAIYRRVPVLGDSERSAGWKLKFWTMFHMSNDSKLFGRVGGDGKLPLFEAKMIHQYNHRFGSYGLLRDGSGDRAHMLPELPDSMLMDPASRPKSYYYVTESDVLERDESARDRGWFLGLREVTSAGLERTLIATVLPFVGVNHKIILLQIGAGGHDLTLSLLACLNSIPLDFCTRQKLGGASLSGYLLRQLPIPDPRVFRDRAPWCPEVNLDNWLRPRALELTYTATDLAKFGTDFSYARQPFRWDQERRALLRAEIDAAFFHLYGLSRDVVDYVLDTFPLVRKSDIKAHGEYRTKRVTLEIYDRLSEAISSGRPYATQLDPAPADPQVEHAPRAVAFSIPKMPAVAPVMKPDEETAVTIWAILHASGGTITRMDLARSFALRSQPAILNKLAPPVLGEIAQAWVDKVGTRAVASGSLTRVLRTLAARGGVRLTTDASSRSVVSTSTGTQPEDKIAPWFQFEARLALQVLAALPPQKVGIVDAGVTGDDRTLLETGVA